MDKASYRVVCPQLKNDTMVNSCKSVGWSAIHMPSLNMFEVKRQQGSGPEEVNDLYFHIYGKFSGWDLNLEAKIWALRLRFGPPG